MFRGLIAIAALGALTACGFKGYEAAPRVDTNLLKSVYQTQTYRPEKIQIITAGPRDLRHFALRPCGSTVCGSHPARITETADGTVVAGAYRGVTFTLARGGGGTLQSGGRTADIAWTFAD